MKEFIKNKIRQGLITENRVKFNLPIPKDILELSEIFKSNGFKLFIVGGAVRDSLLKKPIKDWDLATDAVPEQVEKMMGNAGLRTLPTGKNFGIINVFTDSDEYEVATFRTDSSTGDGRRPDSVEFTTIDQDVKRRDLTINALFFDIDTNEIVDLVGGISDLKNGIVRTVGKPEDRFEEDRLRILRAIRFAGRFGSELEPEVDKALKNDAGLQKISPERIRDEFLKGIKTSKSIKHFLGLLDRYNLFDWIFKGLIVSNNFIEERDPMVLLSWLLRNNDAQTLGKTLNNLTYSSNEVKGITFLVAFQQFDKPEDVFLFKRQQANSGLSDEQIRKFGRLINMDSKILDTFIDFKLSVTGADAERELGVTAGPEMGKAIKQLEVGKFKAML
jgi:tRNA nucleotidyltransferase/poly(A) polymerase